MTLFSLKIVQYDLHKPSTSHTSQIDCAVFLKENGFQKNITEPERNVQIATASASGPKKPLGTDTHQKRK